MKLTTDARPKLSIGKKGFSRQVEDGEYWGVPEEYFIVEGNSVYLDSALATELEWTVDEWLSDSANIAAVSQTVEIGDEHLYIEPGFFCSYVDSECIR